MSTPDPAGNLGATIAAAQDEARHADDAAARVAHARAEAAQRAGVTRPLAAGVLALVLAASLWWAYQHPAPTDDALQRGRELTLQLAAQAVQEQLARTGEPPTDLSELLPSATGVNVRVSEDDVALEMPAATPPLRLTLPRR